MILLASLAFGVGFLVLLFSLRAIIRSNKVFPPISFAMLGFGALVLRFSGEYFHFSLWGAKVDSIGGIGMLLALVLAGLWEIALLRRATRDKASR